MRPRWPVTPIATFAGALASAIAIAAFTVPRSREWLLTPLSASTHHELPHWVVWHGRLMVLAWGILVPLGILVARYCKVRPGHGWPDRLDDPFWWHWHRGLQYSALAVAATALIIAWGYANPLSAPAIWHARLGWFVMSLAFLQLLGGVLRGTKGGPAAPGSDRHTPGDHYEMTRRRILFEYVHKFAGYIAFVCAMATVLLGFRIADAPRWMWVVIIGWWTLILVAAVRWQVQGRCIDTYQAIWGPDPRHPGSALRSIGFGIRKVRLRREP